MSRTLHKAVIAGMTFVLGSALAGCSLLPKEESALKPPLVKPAKENYTTVNAEKGTILKTISGSAVFESVSTDVAQFTAAGGRIDKVLVSQGDQVKKGDPLIQLQVDGLDLQVKEQQLALERAKYAFRQARDADDETLKIAGLQLEIEQIKYDRLSEQFESRQLKSNIDGQIVFVEDLKEGDFVDKYQTLVIIADPKKLRIALRVTDSNSIKDAEVGMPAQVTIGSATEEGKVTQTPSSSPETLNKDLAEKYARTVYIELPKVPADVVIGKLVDVKIVTQERKDVIKIPKSGLRSYLGRNFVRILEEGNRLREVDVEPGIQASTEVEIVQGLEEGQVVVLQ